MNKHYHIELLKLYWELSYDVFITGICTITTLPEIDKTGKFDIQKQFFENKTSDDLYSLLVKDNTLIYICKPIISTDPIEIEEDDKERLYIPITMIERSKSFQYEPCKKFTFTVNTGTRRFETTIDENTYVQNAKKTIAQTLNTYEAFIGDNVSIDYSSKDVLSTKRICDKQEETRKAAYNEYLARITEQERLQELKNSNLSSSVKRMEEQFKKYQDATRLLNETSKKMQELYNNNQMIEKTLNKIKEKLKTLIVQIRNGDIQANEIDSFEEFWKKYSG